MPSHNKQQKRKTGKKRRTGGRMTHAAGHLRARPMTDNLMIKLKWSIDTTITALSSWRFGLAQFWNQKPGYYDEYMKIYKMSRILSVCVRVTVINTTANTPAEIVAVVLPYSDYSKTLDQVKQLPKATMRFLSGGGGIDRTTLVKRANLNHNLGVDSRSIRDYQQSASEAASTLALLPDTPVIALYIGGASTEPTLRVFLTVTYDIEFFQPEYPGSVALSTGPRPIDMTGVRTGVADLYFDPPSAPQRGRLECFEGPREVEPRDVSMRKAPLPTLISAEDGQTKRSAPIKQPDSPEYDLWLDFSDDDEQSDSGSYDRRPQRDEAQRHQGQTRLDKRDSRRKDWRNPSDLDRPNPYPKYGRAAWQPRTSQKRY